MCSLRTQNLKMSIIVCNFMFCIVLLSLETNNCGSTSYVILMSIFHVLNKFLFTFQI